MNPQLNFTEETLVFFAKLRENPLEPDTKPEIREQQLAMINDLVDRAGGDPMIQWTHAWNAVPLELRQMFFMAGMSAIGAAIESLQLTTERTH